MVDSKAVLRRLRDIERRVAALAAIEERGEAAFLADEGLQAQVERHLHLAIQSAIDIAFHILAEDSPLTPEDYASSFRLLARIGVIDEDLSRRLESAAGLRDILVHDYLDIDYGRIWDRLSDLGHLERFAVAVDMYLSS
ncbi:MAG: type VII toxin-antitoxin system HepT family RNase toxin [Actinomycetota bacterium]